MLDESLVIDRFYERAVAALSVIPGAEYELLLVDDGSKDDTYQKMSLLAARDQRVRLIKLSRNFGHQIAITAGLDYATGDCVVVIDADLQDPPEVIGAMVERWRDGYDVVYGKRTDRDGETPMKRITAKAFYRILKAMTNIDIPTDVGDFRLISSRAANELRQLREKDRFIRGLVSWIGFRQTSVPYHREKRFAGATKYPYSKMIKFALDGMTSFSTVPLKMATWMGYAASAFAFIYLGDVLLQKFRGITVQGWASVMVALLFLGGVQLISLGIIGEYLGRVFNETKPRPMYVIEELVALRNDSEARPNAVRRRDASART